MKKILALPFFFAIMIIGAQSALAGEIVQIEVADRVRPGDAVYKVRSA